MDMSLYLFYSLIFQTFPTASYDFLVIHLSYILKMPIYYLKRVIFAKNVVVHYFEFEKCQFEIILLLIFAMSHNRKSNDIQILVITFTFYAYAFRVFSTRLHITTF